jgi:predicted DNA-binding transcriptional regulator AlpA
MAITIQQEQDQLISRRDLAARWNLSIKTIHRREKEGILCPLFLGERTVRYRLSEIIEVERRLTEITKHD